MHINTMASRRREDGRSTQVYSMLCVLEVDADRNFMEEGTKRPPPDQRPRGLDKHGCRSCTLLRVVERKTEAIIGRRATAYFSRWQEDDAGYSRLFRGLAPDIHSSRDMYRSGQKSRKASTGAPIADELQFFKSAVLGHLGWVDRRLRPDPRFGGPVFPIGSWVLKACPLLDISLLGPIARKGVRAGQWDLGCHRRPSHTTALSFCPTIFLRSGEVVRNRNNYQMICTQRGGRFLATIWSVTTKDLPGCIWNSDRTFCLSRSLCPHFGRR